MKAPLSQRLRSMVQTLRRTPVPIGVVVPMLQEAADELESEEQWRRLALQFDGHRMAAMSHLKVLVDHPVEHAAVVREFIKAGPLSGEEVLKQRLAKMVPEQGVFEHACWLHLEAYVIQYLISNSKARMDGYNKAYWHAELCKFFVAAKRRVSIDEVRRFHEADYQAVHTKTQELTDYQAVHTKTQELTDYLDEAIGFPLDGHPDYDKLAPLFFKRFMELAQLALNAPQGN